MVLIEQYEPDLTQLRITSHELGIGFRGNPLLVGSPESIAFLSRNDVDFAEVRTGFGRYSLRKRERNGEKKYWYAFRRADGVLREAYLGLTENVTADLLDEIALKLYQ